MSGLFCKILLSHSSFFVCDAVLLRSTERCTTIVLGLLLSYEVLHKFSVHQYIQYWLSVFGMNLVCSRNGLQKPRWSLLSLIRSVWQI